MEKLLVTLMLALGMLTLLSHGAPSSIAQEGATIISRDECIKQVAEFMASIKLGDEVEQQLRVTRGYYRMSEQYYSKPTLYMLADYPDDCQYLHNQVKSIETIVPCYYNDTIMGVDEVQNIKDVCRISEGARNVLEGEYTCFYYIASGAAMNADGIYDAITGQEWSPM